MLEFKYPYILLLIPLWAVLTFFFVYRQKGEGRVLFPTVSHLMSKKYFKKVMLRRIILFISYTGVFSLLLVALSRPRTASIETVTPEEGVDIVLAIDVSSSMLAEDFKASDGKRMNRLEIVKQVVSDFIKKRESDRIGLVFFAGYAYTQSPLTVDYAILDFLLGEAKIGMIEDGTAIGSAIASSVNRLKDFKSKSRIVILLTDGMNNAGMISPETAVELAKANGIKFYTIGVGSHGPVPYPVTDNFGNKRYVSHVIDFDEALLQMIADKTGGQYFLAEDRDSLENIYATIDSLEKTTREVKHFTHYHELFPAVLKWLCILLVLIAGLENTVFLKIP